MTTIFSIQFAQIAFVLLKLSKASENCLEIDRQVASPKTCPSVVPIGSSKAARLTTISKSINVMFVVVNLLTTLLIFTFQLKQN